MIRRLFWLGVGVAVGVVVVRTVTRAVESYSPSGLAGSAQKSAVGVLDSVREFVADVRSGMAEREEQIYAALAANAEAGDLDPEHPLGDPELEDLAGPLRPYQEDETDR